MKNTKLIIILLFFEIVTGYGQTLPPAHNDTKKEAERLWELAIQAKGGREKLYWVKNMVLISHTKIQFSPFKTYNNLTESLMVFPDKRWTWNDNRPSVFGLSIQMYDYGKGLKYHEVFGSSDNIEKLVPFEANEQDQIGSHAIALVFDLMETYWLKPVPQKVTSERIHGRQVNLVETILDGDRFDFALDQRTNLPIQVSHFYYQPLVKKTLVNISNLSDYVAVDGIMMPLTVRPESEGGKYVRSYQFNVEYEESIFKTPPSFDAGPEAWKPRK